MLRRFLFGLLGVTIPSAALPKQIEKPARLGLVQNFTKMNIEICNALGLNPMKVGGVTISLLPQRAALVTVEHILTNEEVEGVSKIVKRYALGPATEQKA